MSEEVKRGSLTDEETIEDLLDIDNYVGAAAKFIMECDTPMTMAVLGGWGTGKSSFMNMVKMKLKDKEQFPKKEAVIIDFNTWQFSRIGESKLFIPLLSQLVNSIDEINSSEPGYSDFISDKKNKIGFIWDMLGETAITAGSAGAGPYGALAAGIGIVFKSIIDANKKKDTPEEEIQTREDTYEEALTMRRKLQERIDVLTGKQRIENKALKENGAAKKKLVVFVDDLDRLAPVDAVSLLEDMKNFLDCEDTVFVLALDHSLVQRGVLAKYRNSSDDKIDDAYAGKFFEKIVQIPFYLPTNRYNVKNYVSSLIDELGLKDLNPETCVQTIQHFTDCNPRMIKRALNLYKLNEYMSDSISNKDGLFALILLQMCHEDAFKALAGKLAASKERYEMIRLFEDSSQADLILDDEQGEYQQYIDYIKERWPDISKLYDAVVSSTFSAALTDLSKDAQLDQIYRRLCRYLEAKEFERKSVSQDGKVSVYRHLCGQTIEVKRFSNNANINFNGIKKDYRPQYIDLLMKNNLIDQADQEKKYHFHAEQEAYIKNDSELFISHVTNNPDLIHAVGMIVCALLENKDGKQPGTGRRQSRK